MEHPVPQNVTSFEFHLVGDMTLKQFGYLASGFTVAYFSFVFLFPRSPLIALPLIIFSMLLGAAFAFLPIFNQPLDHWALVFFRSIYSPTQGIWKLKNQKGEAAENDPLFKNRLQRYLSIASPVSEPQSPPPLPTIPRMTRLMPLPPKPNPVTQPSMVSTQQSQPQLISLAEQARLLQQQVAAAQQQIKALEEMAKNQQTDVSSYQQKVQETSSNLQNLVQQTNSLSQPSPVNKTEVKIVEPKKEIPTQIVLTSLPNVINGIVTDNQENYLDGAIVIIHNSEGLPVRALKTNKLGQFSGATPLPSGTYTITLEKEGLSFNTLQIDLEGETLQPISIHPKKITNELFPHSK